MHILLVGGGKVGGYLAARLLEHDHQVTVIEARADVVARLRRELSARAVVHGNGTDPDVLETAGIHQADVVAAVTSADETNMVIVSLARYAFHVPRTVGRVNNPRNAWMFTPELGTDIVLNQADVIAHLILEKVT
jgi:trk system potassium uptake protein TrkA